MDTQEALVLGLQTTLIGMSITFGVLILVAVLIVGLNKVLDPTQRKNGKEDPAPSKETTPVNFVKPIQTADNTLAENQHGLSPAIVAAITGAIMAVTGKTAAEIKFTKIARATTGSSNIWAKAGTAEIISTRQRFLDRKGI